MQANKESTGRIKLLNLEKTVRAYDVLKNSDPKAVFTIYPDDEDQGFSMNCTPLNHPEGSFWQQYYDYCERARKLGIHSRPKPVCFLGTCRWRWTKDKTDIAILTVYTQAYALFNAQLIAETDIVNRIEDITWAREKITWLWQQSLPDLPLPRIKQVRPPNKRKEHLDLYDYL
jgi:hypothetical protein